MATLKYKTPEGEWKKVSIGGGGSTEEVYVGSDTPPKGTKVWIDPTGTPSGGNGGGTSGGASVEIIDNLESDSTTAALSANQGRVLKEMIGQGGASGGSSNVFVFPEEVLSDEYTADNPYLFSSEKYAELDAALLNPSSVYVVYQNQNNVNISSLQVQISFTQVGLYGSVVTYLMGYLFIYLIHFTKGEDGILTAYPEAIMKQL